MTKNPYFWLIVIIVFGFLARLYKIDSPIADWHSWRQSDTAAVSRIFYEEGVNLLYPRYYDISSIQSGIFNPRGYRFVEFPIFNAIHALAAKGLGFLSFETVGRLVSIFSWLASTIFIFLLGKRFIGIWGGVLAAFFFSFIPYNIYFSRVILPEPQAVTFALVSIWLFSEFIEKEKGWQLYLSGVFFALSMLVKPFTFFYGLPFIYLALEKYGRKLIYDAKILIKFLIFLNIFLVPFFLWRIWMNQFPAGIPHFAWAFNGDEIRFRPAWWRWIFGERIGQLILGIWGIIPFVFGIMRTQKRNIFNTFFFLGTLIYVTVFATANVRHDYYQVYLIPPVSLLLAAGSMYLYRTRNFNSLLSRFILIFSIVMMLGMGGYQVKDFYRINHPEIIEAGAALDKIAAKDAKVIAPYSGDTAFLYQTKRYGWPVVEDSIEETVKKGAKYFVTVNFADPDTSYVEKNYTVLVKTDKYLIADITKPKGK